MLIHIFCLAVTTSAVMVEPHYLLNFLVWIFFVILLVAVAAIAAYHCYCDPCYVMNNAFDNKGVYLKNIIVCK